MIFVDCNANKTLQSWFEFFIPIDHYKSASWNKIKKCLGKNHWTTTCMYVLMIYQHDEPFKIIGVFNYYAFIDYLLQRKVIGPRNNAIQLLVIFVTTKA